MEKLYYTAQDVERTLEQLEHRYGISSDEFAAAVANGDTRVTDRMPGRVRAAWMSFYEESRELDGDDFASRVARELEPA